MQMILLFRNVFALPVLLVLVNPGVNFVHGKRLRKARQTTSSNHETPNSAPSSKRKVDNAGSVNDIFDGDTIIPLRFLEFSMALMPTDMPSRTRALPDSASTNAPSSNIPTERPTSSLDSNEIVSPPTKPITESTRAPSAFPITASPTKSPSMAPTGNCNLTSERRKEMIRNILFKVSLETDMTDPRSPQSRALDWIVNKDSLRLCPKNQKELIQRYVAAVFYYSAGGGSWDECNAPMDLNDPNELDKANDNCNIRASSFPGDVFGTNAWLTPTNECEWGGLSCLPESSECSMCIDQISFEDNSLKGTIPFEIRQFTEMKRLSLQRGKLSSTIPIELLSLTKLLVLDLDYNELSGPLHGELFENWQNMKELDLNNNFLSGTITTKIGMLESLRFLQIDSNEFSGTIPTQLGNLKELVFASLTDLNLNGMMPSQVCANRGIPSDPSNGNLSELIADCETPDSKVFCECCSACNMM